MLENTLRKQVLRVIGELGLNLSGEYALREEFSALNRGIDLTNGSTVLTHPYEKVIDHLIFVPLLDIHWGQVLSFL